jgi:hypothetical protein
MKLNFDGDLLFTGSSDKKINVWDAYTGERIGYFFILFLIVEILYAKGLIVGWISQMTPNTVLQALWTVFLKFLKSKMENY